MIKRTPQQAGRDYEHDLAQRLGGRPQPNSGAGVRYKLDLKLSSILFSVKHTEHESYRLTAANLREALSGAQGPGGRGEIPAMAIRMQGFPEDVFVLRASDLVEILQGDVELEPTVPSRRQARLAAARAR